MKPFKPQLLVLLLLLVACSSENRVVSRLENTDREQLVSEAIQLWESSQKDGAWGDIPSGLWPGGIRRFKPPKVSVSEDGVYLETWSAFVMCDGLFVLPPDSAFNPATSGDPSYEHIDGRLYYYKVLG